MTVPPIPPAIREILACPRCHGSLVDAPAERDGESAMLRCERCAIGFPVRGGVPVLLLDQARALGQ